MKEKLIKLISSASFSPDKGVVRTIGSRFSPSFIEAIADHLIANGVTIDPERRGGCAAEKRSTDLS